MLKISRAIGLGLWVLAGFSLTGCQSSSSDIVEAQQAKASVFVGAAYEEQDRTTAFLLESPQEVYLRRLRRAGVQVLQQGDRFRFVLQQDRFFEGATTAFIPAQRKTLKTLAAFIRSYPNANARIHVYGYTDKTGSVRDQQLRSAQYAEVITAFLWSQGIPRDRVQTLGVGAGNPVATNRTPAGSAMNRRVEVLLD